MCVCVCVCVFVFTYLCMRAGVYAYLEVHLCMIVGVCACASVNVCLQLFLCTSNHRPGGTSHTLKACNFRFNSPITDFQLRSESLCSLRHKERKKIDIDQVIQQESAR